MDWKLPDLERKEFRGMKPADHQLHGSSHVVEETTASDGFPNCPGRFFIFFQSKSICILYGLVLSKLRSDHCDVESLTLFDVPMFGAHILIIPRSFIINFEGLFAPCIVCLPIYIYTHVANMLGGSMLADTPCMEHICVYRIHRNIHTSNLWEAL